MARINRSEFSAHAAIKAGANQPVRVVRPAVKPQPIRWSLCILVGVILAAVVVIAGGAL